MSTTLPSEAGPTDAAGDGDETLRHVARTVLPTDVGPFDLYAYVDPDDGADHVAMVMGDVTGGDPPLVRVHSECLTGDALGSHRCDCGDQLLAAQRAIAREGRGAVMYLRGHEGRGIGLTAKLRPTRCRTRASTRSTPTWRSACPPTCAATGRPRRSSTTSASTRSG